MNLNMAWNAIRVVLREEFSFYDIKEIAGLAGIEVARLAHLVQKSGSSVSKGQLVTALDGEIARLGPEAKRAAMSRIADAIVADRPNAKGRLESYLRPLGWSFVEGKFLPVEVFDALDLAMLPEDAHGDLAKAASRFRDGDLGGSLSAACGAVDSAVQAVFDEFKLGNSATKGFQARCGLALRTKGTLGKVAAELTSLGWDERDARNVAKNMEGSLKQGAFVMQSLRSRMSDVHGTKGVVPTMVFDSMKWAALIVAALK